MTVFHYYIFIGNGFLEKDAEVFKLLIEVNLYCFISILLFKKLR